jgi:hypothetical protein
MLASDLPFRRVIGVELNPALVSTARKNLVKWMASSHACEEIEILNADALEFAFPDSPTLLYVFNPFDAHVTQLLLDRIHAVSLTRSAPIDIIYMTPEHADLFAAVPNLHLLKQGRAPLTPEEMAVDAFQTQSLGYCLYRLPPPPK